VAAFFVCSSPGKIVWRHGGFSAAARKTLQSFHIGIVSGGGRYEQRAENVPDRLLSMLIYDNLKILIFYNKRGVLFLLTKTRRLIWTKRI
jgi:hypothetical protein